MSLNRNVAHFLIALISVLIISGCQSTKPEWYSKPKVDNDEYIYAVAQARTLSHAKKIAVNNINEKLWTQVESSFYMRDTMRETNGSGFSNSLVDNKVNTKTESLTLNGIEYLQMEENDLGAFVEVKIQKSLVTQQLIREIEEINRKAQREITALKHEDRLLWWLDNRTAYQMQHDASVRIAMLAPLIPDYKADVSSIEKLVVTHEEVSSQINIRLSSDRESSKAVQLLGNQLSQFNIATSTSKKKNQTHILKVDSERRRNKVGDAFISTLVSNIKVVNMKSKTVSRSEIISTGNSVTNYKYADEGAARHFDEQVKEQGIWTALGLIK
ncbi:LPP20 family lipoprotein [Vibrio sp. D404a]|uniref:LPP20 family lipoprotein n=1 Tax=unclassified Vibrio TaxID=2614977 RepID=UPI002557AAB6|nr:MULTISPECIES: LPP20 family lipoprotein [unclassified Vibrio]MDK9736511.1 LPP20 family lipoprotein [Vibrio sp. D404a]MDK9796820.1 LPP20 family lipoprotein [Vibrio sp. D449a]